LQKRKIAPTAYFNRYHYFVLTIPHRGLYIENTPPPPGRTIADVIWWENMKGEEKKGENVTEKGERGKKMRKEELKG
jgi:hypothetical protein